ncbi:AraC family transcriptional regulator [Flavobacterium columnare]|uniref:helix-turn-helix domain-containing protein n=1 Tax=Flavobacterium TaxID=237 RepID=UPI0018968CA6|nr:helix-turn-helix domain-containing protein [Flavobacterium columnare]MBF6652943.1 AraC family transcriptional regulator [Flavobacterium columnare]MBF6657551.1 AraC family transcriptional regulator [Flavobacterium columnare]
MKKSLPYTVNNIVELHELFFLPPPKHPLITVIDLSGKLCLAHASSHKLVFNFYSVWIKKNPSGKLGYGQQFFDFDNGSLTFQSPKQVVSIYDHQFTGGWALAFHPDFIQNYPLAKNINKFDFFSYSVNQALHISDDEENKIVSLMKSISEEYEIGDPFSQDIIVTHIETLLNYANRFYNRQALELKKKGNDLLSKLEKVLSDYFERNYTQQQGLPTVQYLANELNLSPHYLGDTLKSLTGQTAQQHIHNRMIEKAKEKLSTTNSSVSEIAYELGFEHPQSFSKLFRTKTNLSPMEFRQSFS